MNRHSFCIKGCEGMFRKTQLGEVVTVDAVISIHYFDYSRNFSFPGEAHDFWEMVFIDSGEVVATADGTDLLLRRGEVLFHRPGEYHAIRANGDFAGVVVITFDTRSDAASHLAGQRATLDDVQKAYISQVLKTAAQTFAGPLDIVDQTALVKLTDAPFGAEQVIKNQLELLLISIIRPLVSDRAAAGDGVSGRASEEVIVSRIKKILEENIYGNITLDEICSHINFSKSYIKSTFKKATGCGIHLMYVQMKISLSKRLLSEEIYSVSEISEKLGFSSIHHFSRAFKQAVGMPPTAYVKSVRRRALL